MIFTETGNDGTSFALPIHVYDPAKVVMVPDFGEYLVTEAPARSRRRCGSSPKRACRS